MEIKPYKNHILISGSTVKEALARLDILAKDAILFIVAENGRLIGSLTDGDVRRGLLKGFGVDSLVDDIIQPEPKYIRKGDHDIAKVIEYRKNNFRIIPVLDEQDQVINIINFRLMKSYLPIDAVIMAGGRGERLRPLTDNTPKPLLRVGDKPIIEHCLDRLVVFGVDDFWISVRYLGEQIEAFLGNGQKKNVSIQYIREDEPLGTIGAASTISNFLHDYVLITNSDLLSNIDYEHFLMEFIERQADFAVVSIPYHVDVPYAVLETNNGHVLSFKEKPTYTYYSNGGIYLMKRAVLEYLPPNTHYNATDLMELLIKAKKKIMSYPFVGYWLDIGRKEDFEKAKYDINTIQF